MKILIKTIYLISMLGMVSGSAQAADLSMMTGLYKNEKSKRGGKDLGSKSTLDIGARYGDKLDGELLEWFGQGMLVLRNYTSGEAKISPSSSTSLSLGGGVRQYFDPFSENAAPFASMMGEYRADKNGDFNGAASYYETEISGLYYSAAVGIRMGLSGEFFVDFEADLFESALFATESRTDVTLNGDGDEVKTETETSKTELQGDTVAALTDMRISLGMRF